MEGALKYTIFNTELGTVFAASNERGFCRLTIAEVDEKWFTEELIGLFGREIERDDSLGVFLKKDFRYYVGGSEVTWDYEYDISWMTPFQRKVLDAVRKIPHGSTTTYGEISRSLGRGASASRAVGGAVGANPLPIIIPCHRVLASGGGLGGFGLGLGLKKRLLEIEGVL